MTRQSKITICLWTIAALLAVLALLKPVVQEARAQGTKLQVPSVEARLAPVPYTVVLQSVLISGQKRTSGTRSIRAKQLDGSELLWLEQVVGDTPNRVSSQRFFRFADGTRIDTDEIAKRKSTYPPIAGYRRPPLMAPRDPANNCLLIGETPADGLVIAGQRTVGVNRDAVARQAETLWLAPALNCAELKARRVSGESVEERAASLVTVGPPDSALFAVGTEYAEVLPSVLYRRDPNDASGARMDRLYRRAQGIAAQK